MRLRGGIVEEIVGREAELEGVERFLDAVTSGSAALIVEGEAGIGKTSIWGEACERGLERGFRVLGCRPAEAEAKLSFSSLADLLDPVDEEELTELPEPQRRALAVALLRAESAGPPPDQRTTATAFVSVLTNLAANQPVVVAIDDVQWLDGPSAGAVAFAARRVGDRPVGLLVSHRIERNDACTPLELDRTFPEQRLFRVRLGGLSLAALHHVVRLRLGEAPPRPTLIRIERTSAGNPFFAVELARALRESSPVSGEPLPVPDNLLGLVRRRVDALPARAREVALAAAALATPTRLLVRAVSGEGAAQALERAEQAGVLEERAGRLRFTHPLLASAVYSSAPAERRRRLHRRLADVVEDLEEQARHLALAAAGPEADTAAVLQDAAANAKSRGVASAAVELMDLCCKLTPPNEADELARRELELAECLLRSGDASGSQSLAQRLVETLPSGPLHARACELVARLLHVTGAAQAATAVCEQALAEVGDDDALRARILTTLSRVAYDDLDRALRHGRAALELLENMDAPDPVVLSEALWSVAGAEQYCGRRLPMDYAERALELERLAPNPYVADRVSAGLGALLKYADDFAGSRRWLEETHRAAVDEGDEGSLPYALSHFPQLELWTGNWQRAEEAAREHLELAGQTGQLGQRSQALYNLALVLAHQGREREARDAIREVLDYTEEAGDDWVTSMALSVLGFLELALDRPREAVGQLERSLALLAEMSATPSRHAPDLVEALVTVGDLRRAREVLDAYEEHAQAVGRVSALAAGARSRALLLAAQGGLDEAIAAAEEALRHHEQVAIPLDLGRAHLVLGTLRRRRKEKRLAKEALERALEIFEDLGAALWAEKARSELGRVGLRRAAGWELTETERRVAELAAAGRTNREVAQELFISPKTVEANLARVYRKLDISSRAELGARMTEGAQSPQT